MAGRLIAGIFAVLLGIYSALGLILQIVSWSEQFSTFGGVILILACLATGSVAFLLGWYARTGSQKVKCAMSEGAICGVLMGALGFVVGLLGPILFAPDANQGPLLGIFFTGPIGAYLGFMGAVIIGLMKTDGDEQPLE